MTGVGHSVTVQGHIYVVTLTGSRSSVFTVNGYTGSVADRSGAAVTGNDVSVVCLALRSEGYDPIADVAASWWRTK